MIRKIFSLLRGNDSKKVIPAKPEETKAPTGKPETGKPATKKPAGKPEVISNKPNLKAKTPEQLCSIDPKKMSTDVIKNRLAELYKRHNHAAGSLNEELRKEAEVMLDAVVACREKYVDKKK